ncbi:hypothetical protein B0H10DRAFT_2243711 [Mycena sp. CBHHK59/15]|nr:hypothetical protein B0H10DRAFT_2243711 [Mycena sp. CBHHK59/15]
MSKDVDNWIGESDESYNEQVRGARSEWMHMQTQVVKVLREEASVKERQRCEKIAKKEKEKPLEEPSEENTEPTPAEYQLAIDKCREVICQDPLASAVKIRLHEDQATTFKSCTQLSKRPSQYPSSSGSDVFIASTVRDDNDNDNGGDDGNMWPRPPPPVAEQPDSKAPPKKKKPKRARKTSAETTAEVTAETLCSEGAVVMTAAVEPAHIHDVFDVMDSNDTLFSTGDDSLFCMDAEPMPFVLTTFATINAVMHAAAIRRIQEEHCSTAASDANPILHHCLTACGHHPVTSHSPSSSSFAAASRLRLSPLLPHTACTPWAPLLPCHRRPTVSLNTAASVPAVPFVPTPITLPNEAPVMMLPTPTPAYPQSCPMAKPPASLVPAVPKPASGCNPGKPPVNPKKMSGKKSTTSSGATAAVLNNNTNTVVDPNALIFTIQSNNRAAINAEMKGHAQTVKAAKLVPNLHNPDGESELVVVPASPKPHCESTSAS